MEPSGVQREEVVGVAVGTNVDDAEEIPESGILVGPGAEQVREAEEESNVGLELGDLVVFHSNRADIETVKGRIYYIDESRVSILEDGKPRKLVIYDMEEDEDGDYVFKEEYELTGADIKEKRLLPSFVAQRGMAKDMLVETFTDEGEQLVTYTIKTVDEVKDSATLVDEAGEELVLDFSYKGIPRDRSIVPFDVLRVIEPPKKEETVPNEAAKGEVEEDVVDFEFLDDLEAPDEDVVVGLFQGTQKPAWEILYDDEAQLNDMLRERIRELDPAAQRSVKRIRGITRLVWNMMILRNDITRYQGQKPIGRKPVAFSTLVELLEKTQFPLAKLVLDVSKAIYVDHKYVETADGLLTLGNDPTSLSDPQIMLQYLEDVLKTSESFIDSQLSRGAVTAEVPGGGLVRRIPRWITFWQGYFNRFFLTISPIKKDADTKDIRFDQDFFRFEIPNDGTLPSTISGFPTLDSDKTELVQASSLRKVPFSYMRALTARYGRYGEGGLTHKIEDADQAEIKGFLIFPLQFIRDLGYTRSGVLLYDVVHGMTTSKSMFQILKETSIVDIPEANKIVSVSFDGSTLGNVQIADWLKGQAIYGGGIGDLMPYLRSFGLLQAEFTVAQKTVLDKKIAIYRAGVKNMLRVMREEIQVKRKERKPIQTFSLLDKQSEFELFKTITAEGKGEPLLKQLLADFNVRHPSYSRFDVARFAYLYIYYPDLLLNTVAQNPEVAKERLRAERDIFIQEVLNTLAKEKKLQDRGDPPQENPCQHVKDLNKIRLIQDNTERMESLNKFVRLYKLKKEDHWLWCNNGEPPHHLLCEHEYLLLQEFLRPKEKEVIHKEIILTFSGGKFNGQYICKQCGQAIAEYEYDNHLEKSDEGTTLSGAGGVMMEDENEEMLLSALFPETDDKEIAKERTEEKNKEQLDEERKIFLIISELASLVGIFPDPKSYAKMISYVRNIIITLPNRAAYAQSQKALKKGQVSTDYDVFINRILVCLCASALIIDVQTHIPDYVVRYTLTGCAVPEFTGYPRDPDASKPNTAMEYMACAISSITKRSEPWDLTGFQSISSTTNRMKEILFYIKNFTEKLAETTEVQQSIIDKKQYLLETFGYETALGRPQDIIPFGFTPVPFVPTKELAAEAEAPVIAETASVPEKVRAYIKQAHIFALKYGKYNPGVKFTEAACCYNPLTNPAEFWNDRRNMPELPPYQSPQGSEGSVLYVHMTPRPMERLFGRPDESLMYRLFLRVCFRGPRKGEQHEPGYDNVCPWCGLKFPENPSLPPPTQSYSKEKAVQKKYDADYESALQTKKAEELQALRDAGLDAESINDESFEELLNTVNKRRVLPYEKPDEVPNPLENIRGMLSLLPPPFEGFEAVIRQTVVALESLPSGAERRDVINAFTELSQKVVDLEAEIRRRLGEEGFSVYQELVKLSSQDLGEALRSYFLIPFQRVITNFGLTVSRFRPAFVKQFSPDVIEDIQTAYARHISYLNDITKDIPKTDKFIKAKMKEVVDRLSVVCPVLIGILRPTVVRGGNIASNFLQRLLVSGIFAEFVMPNHVPFNDPSLVAPTTAMSAPAKIPAQILQASLLKFKQEGLSYSEDQIREMIQDRMEKEKAKIIRDKNDMTPEERKLDNILQRNGMGKWAVGGTKAIWRYDPNQYVSERDAMEAAGITRFGAQEDVYERTGGYDVVQTGEDDA